MSTDDAVAVIADVHGNRWALEAVLEDLQRRGIGRVLNLGDSLYGPLDPAGTAALFRHLDPVSVRGNQDRLLLEPTAAAADSPTFRFVVEQLPAEDLDWLAGHEIAPLMVGGFALCHGTPDRDDAYLAEQVTEHGVALRHPDELAHDLASLDAEVVLCGHSHMPRLIAVPGGQSIVNPGSVGLPAYTDDRPCPHAMEAGSPHARYAVLERSDRGWLIELRAIVYDWERAARAAEQLDRADWAAWLRSGRATV